MDWTQAWTIIGVTAALFAGTVAVVIAIFLHIDAKFSALVQVMHAEMKDFHGRLCAIEERRSRN